MEAEQWEVVDEIAGSARAEMLRGLLEAQGLQVLLSQEGAGRAYGLTFGTLGMVQVLVASQDVERARAVVEQYYAGEFEDTGAAAAPTGEDDSAGERGEG